MKKATIFICVTFYFIVGYAKQNKFDIGINLGRDCIAYHMPGYTSGYFYTPTDVSPITTNILLTYQATDAVKVGIRSGYARRTMTMRFDTDAYSTKLNGLNVQAVGLVNRFLYDEQLSFYAGISVGFYDYIMYQYDNSRRDDQSKTETSGFAQTFLFGCSFRISENLKLSTTFEKVGLNTLNHKWDYYDYEGRKIGEYVFYYQLKSGFQDVGIIMGLVYSL
jgi:hypothetical protein